MKLFRFLLLLTLVSTVHLCDATSLFRAYPALKETVPHVSLCSPSTPVRKLSLFASWPEAPEIYVKDDNWSTSTFAGNKPRKLEFLLADAKAKGCAHIVTSGSTGSNFGCATAVFAKKLGFASCTCIYSPQINTKYLQRNALWATLAGAQFVFCKDRDERQEQCEKALTCASSRRTKTYYIPSGGSNALGSLGFVNAAFELKAQIDAGTLPAPDEIFLTFGSGGSVSGLLLGLKAAGLPCRVITTCVVSDPDKTAYDDIKKLFDQTNDLLQDSDPSFPRFALTREDVTVDHDHYYGEYAQMNEQESRAISYLHALDGIKTDGTYAGKTLVTLFHWIPRLAGKKILFWNTFCSGNPMEQFYDKYTTLLAPEWHPYFDGTIPLQTLDQGL